MSKIGSYDYCSVSEGYKLVTTICFKSSSTLYTCLHHSRVLLQNHNIIGKNGNRNVKISQSMAGGERERYVRVMSLSVIMSSERGGGRDGEEQRRRHMNEH